jgi:hypothetical protein
VTRVSALGFGRRSGRWSRFLIWLEWLCTSEREVARRPQKTISVINSPYTT